MPKATLREFVFGFSINFFWKVWSFLQDDVQCGRRTGMSMLANAQNRWERTGKKTRLGGATSSWISWFMHWIYPRTQDAIVAHKGLGWDSLQELSKNPGGFHLSYAEGEASLVGMVFFFRTLGRNGSFLWSTHVFHEWFSPRVQTSRFFKQQVFGCWPDKKTPFFWILTLHATVIPIYFHYFIIKQVSLLYLSLTL